MKNAIRTNSKYIVKWGECYSQECETISESVKIIRELVKEYNEVTLIKK